MAEALAVAIDPERNSIHQNIKRYLHQQAFKYGKAETSLDAALYGSIEQWNVPS